MPESNEVNTAVPATIDFTIEELVHDGEPLNDPDSVVSCGCSGCSSGLPPVVV